jgi:Tfp pilus assembly PilM family ATPase
MSSIPIVSSLAGLLTTPAFPRTAISIDSHRLALVSLKRSSGQFEPRHLSTLDLPVGLVNPSFTEPNLSDEGALSALLERLLNEAGLNRARRFAVAIPDASARSQIITLEGASSTAAEFEQLLGWKIERAFGCRPSEVRVSERCLYSSQAESHWLVTVVQKRVIAQYENAFKQLRWQVGLIVPGYLAEAQWLLRSGSIEDQVLLSLHENGFVAVVVRAGEPALVREVTCEEKEREDEFFRLMVFYRDRLMPKNASVNPSRLLVIGPPDAQQRFRKTLSDAMEAPVTILDAGSFGLRLPGQAPFPSFAAAAGLSTFAWA